MARWKTIMKETHELYNVPYLGNKMGQSCLPWQRPLFHFPYPPPRLSPGRQPGLTKTNLSKQKPTFSSKPQSRQNWVNKPLKAITTFWNPPVTTIPTAFHKAETANPKTSCRLSTGLRPTRPLLKALTLEEWRKACLTSKSLLKNRELM